MLRHRLPLCCCLLLIPAVQAEPDTTTTELPEVVTTATRGDRLLLDVPYAATRIDADALRLGQAPRTLPDALKHEPGIMLQRTAHGQGSPYIRGFTGYRNLMLIDGIRLNNAVFRDGPNQYWNTVDSLMLRQVEVVRGPASVLYGSDAIGGTVQALSRGQADLRPDSSWDRRLTLRYADAEDSYTARAESIGRLTESLTLTLGYTYKDFGELRGGHRVGRQEQTDYIERHGDAKIEYRPSAGTTLTAAHQQGRIDDAWRTHGTIYGTTWAGLDMGSDLRRALDQQRDLTYLQIRHNPYGPLIETVHAGLYRQAQSEMQDRLRTGDRWNVQGFDVESFGAILTLTSRTPIGRLTYGLDAQRDRVDTFSRNLSPDGSVRSAALQGPVADDSTYDLAGLFVQSETPLHHRLDLLLGGRYAYASADAPRVENPNGDEPLSVSGNWNAVVGTARLTYALDELRSTLLYAGVAQGFRAPNLSNLTRFDIARTDEIETPVEDLDPEYYLTGEVGIKAAGGPLSGQLAYSYTHIDGMIIRTPTGRVIDGANEVTKRNAGDGYVQSLELDIRYRIWRELSIFGAFTWMAGKVDTYLTADSPRTRDYVSRLMPPAGRAGLRWQQGERYWIETACTAAARASRLAAGDVSDTSRIPPGGTPGYTVLDIRAGWRATPDLAFSVALENLTDEDYRIHGSGLNEPGRNLVLAADWTF